MQYNLTLGSPLATVFSRYLTSGWYLTFVKHSFFIQIIQILTVCLIYFTGSNEIMHVRTFCYINVTACLVFLQAILVSSWYDMGRPDSGPMVQVWNACCLRGLVRKAVHSAWPGYMVHGSSGQLWERLPQNWKGWGYSSVTMHLLGVSEALGSSPCATNNVMRLDKRKAPGALCSGSASLWSPRLHALYCWPWMCKLHLCSENCKCKYAIATYIRGWWHTTTVFVLLRKYATPTP